MNEQMHYTKGREILNLIYYMRGQQAIKVMFIFIRSVGTHLGFTLRKYTDTTADITNEAQGKCRKITFMLHSFIYSLSLSVLCVSLSLCICIYIYISLSVQCEIAAALLPIHLQFITSSLSSSEVRSSSHPDLQYSLHPITITTSEKWRKNGVEKNTFG